MSKHIRKIGSAMLLAFIVSLAFATSMATMNVQTVRAQEGVDGLTLVAFDTSLTDMEDIEAAQFAANLVLSNADDGRIFVGEYGEVVQMPRQYSTPDEAKIAINEIVDRLQGNAGAEGPLSDVASMLESYSAFIGQLDGVVDGRMFVLSAGRFDPDTQAFGSIEGIQIDTVSLATTPTADRDVLAAISDAGGGIPYDLGFVEGVIEFINIELDTVLEASLNTEAAADREQLAIDVPPHTSYLLAGFTFEGSETSNLIEQPNGQAITGAVGSVVEFAHAGFQFYAVRNPEPGVWRLLSSDGSGPLTIFSKVVNRVNLVMPIPAPFPAGEPFLLTANTRFGEIPLIDASATIEAIVTSPNGTNQVYVMNDRGEDGDVFAEDGTFSVTVSPQEEIGVSNVALSMGWPGLTSSIATSGAFVVEPFPTIEINPSASGSSVSDGVRSLLATVDLKLGEFPFLTDIDDIAVSVTNVADGSAVPIELEPIEIVDGKVYSLNVFAALTAPGEYEFDAQLKSLYLERDFAAMAAKRSADIEVQAPLPLTLYVVAGAVGLLVLVILILVLRGLFQIRPSGYLYRLDAAGGRELVANFGDYRHSLWDWMFNKSSVPAAALPAVPLLGGRFVFSKQGLFFQYRRESDGMLRMTIAGEVLREGANYIAADEEFQMASDRFIYDYQEAEGKDVRVSERLLSAERARQTELEEFALDPMTWDAPSSARPVRIRRR